MSSVQEAGQGYPLFLFLRPENGRGKGNELVESTTSTSAATSIAKENAAESVWVSGRSTAREAKLAEMIEGWIQPLGYKVVHLELIQGREPKLRVFIDFSEVGDQLIGIEDCVTVTKAINEPLDEWSETEGGIKEAYDLEVSSPGMNRPLRRREDFLRFGGERIRIHTVRPATAEELGDEALWNQNSKRKNFVGTLVALETDELRFVLESEKKASAKKGKRKAKADAATEEVDRLEVGLPLSIISKVYLDPEVTI
jgi:ribosome maturation factor RimP